MWPFRQLKNRSLRRSREQRAKLARDYSMNTEEGHLGGYIRASEHPPASGLDTRHGDPLTYSPTLWRWVHDQLGVQSVLDVGCGEGHCAAFFRNLGCEVLGVDGSKQARLQSLIPEHHVVHDYAGGPYSPSTKFDLVWSCEFVEHVEERYLPNFLETFRASRRYLMFTYAPPGQAGWHHVNCQPAEYWVEKMRAIEFLFDAELTRKSTAGAEPGHYRDKGLFFVREAG
jgi:SAM-dependent methyltransferase